jgi:hypothetical protein
MHLDTYHKLMEHIDPERFRPSVAELFQSYQSAIDSIDLYILHGTPLGGQLTATIQNDLKNAMGMADIARRRVLFAIVSYLYNDVPSCCWGSKEKHDAWMALDHDQRADVVARSEYRVRSSVAPDAGKERPIR